MIERECSGDKSLHDEVGALLRTEGNGLQADSGTGPVPRIAGSMRSRLSIVSPTASRSRTRSQMLTAVTRTIGNQGQSALAIVLAMLILSAFIGWAYINVRASLRSIRADELRLLVATSVAAVESYIELEKANVHAWSEKERLREAVYQLTTDSNGDAQAARATIDEVLAGIMGHQPQYLIFGETNRVLAASSQYENALGRRSAADGSALITETLSGKTLILTPILHENMVEGHAVDLMRPEMPMMLPIFAPHDSQEIIAAMYLRGIGMEDRFFELLQSVRVGLSGETYAFDQKAIMISESRFNDTLRSIGLIDDRDDSYSCLSVQIRDPGGDLTRGYRLNTPVAAQPLTKMAAFATAGENDLDLDGYRDYRGVTVVGAWQWLPQYGFGIATEVDYAETYGPMKNLNLAFAAIGVLILGSIGFIIYSARYMARMRRQASNVQNVGPYALGRLLGEGGMGQVYLAQHALLKRPTAVKLLHPENLNVESIARFEREVQLSSKLSHPNTIEVYDYGQTAEGIFYYAMEYLQGITLSTLIRDEGELPVARVIYFLESICKSLREAHGLGIVHRDIKPQNIMVCQRGGESDVVKVLDFGLVKPMQSNDHAKITRTMGVIGTPLYMAPERIREPSSNDPRSDIYSLGAVGFNLLTGHDIFNDVSDFDVYFHIINTVPPRVRDLAPNIPPELDQLIAECLEKEVGKRPESVVAILNRLQALPVQWTTAMAEAWWQSAYAPKSSP
ncbi:Serine/threonine-protein kinase PknB [Rosistilla carotiformis]|uniref:Serine/threonine-protein kinase PknB n=2 Tax=Rosistilla carotiformis TaxID=2528017 RepID=A0A518JY23_9BACT|nr:Serine/threonine-protein kinase PknB [Rosistilla carotiformis]